MNSDGVTRHETIYTLEATPMKFGPGAAEEAGWELRRLGATRVLLVSDLHPNAAGLAVLPRADAVLCAGDVVDYGPDPRAAIAWCRSRCDAVVHGNHDRALAYDEPDGVGASMREASAATRSTSASTVGRFNGSYPGHMVISAREADRWRAVRPVGDGIKIMNQTLHDALLSLLFAAIGFVLLFAGYRLFDRLTPTSLSDDVFKNGNVAAAIVMSALIIGVAIIIYAAMLPAPSTPTGCPRASAPRCTRRAWRSSTQLQRRPARPTSGPSHATWTSGWRWHAASSPTAASTGSLLT